MFSLSGKLFGHFPVDRSEAAVFLKRSAAAITKDWDGKVNDSPVTPTIEEVIY